VRALATLRGARAVTGLLEVLEDLAAANGVRALAARGYAPVLDRHAQTRLGRVIAHAVEHASDRVTLADLARAAAMTPSAFSRYFRRAAGVNPMAFVRHLRLEEAARLLRDTDLRVADIAGAVGFTTLTSFNRRFRERTGTTPRAYRRSLTRVE
jgi:transcriptional regulator GlxA family with amidase domain